MRNRNVFEEPFLSIVREEWKKAKKIFPGLKKQPSWKWHYENLSNHGRCLRYANTILLSIKYLEFKDSLEHIEEFKKTVRHEIAHLQTTGHGQDFLYVMNRLGANRYAGCSFRKPLTPEHAKFIEEKNAKYRLQLSICHSCNEKMGNERSGWNWKCGKSHSHHWRCMPCKNPVALIDKRLSKKENVELFNKINK